MSIIRKEVFFFLLWRLLSSGDFNNSCAPFKLHTYKVAGSRPRKARLKGPRAHTVRQIPGGAFFLDLFTWLVQRHPLHLQLSLLKDGPIRFNLIHVKKQLLVSGIFIELYKGNERQFIKISSVHTDTSIKSQALLFFFFLHTYLLTTAIIRSMKSTCKSDFKMCHLKKKTRW